MVVVRGGGVFDAQGLEIGVCPYPTDELHVTMGAMGGIVLDGGKECGIYPMRAGRSKRDEMWHRWASLGRDQGYLKARTLTKPPRAIVRLKWPCGASGSAFVSMLTVFRPSTGETFEYAL